MPKVYIVNRSGHDYSDALRFGNELIFLTEGKIRQTAINNMYRDMTDKMRDSTPEDYLVITSLPVLSAVAASILGYKHGRVNLLIYKDGRYLERNILLSEIFSDEGD